MKHFVLAITFILFLFNSNGQIMLNKNGIFVESFVKQGDTYLYTNSYENFIINRTDTIVNEKTFYETEMTIISVSDSSFLIQWINRNIKTNSKNEGWQLLMKCSENLKTLIEIKKNGYSVSVKNWKDLQDSIWNRVNEIPTINMTMDGSQELVRLVKSFYASKESIETATIPHTLQYFMFHGFQYEYNKPYDNKSIINTLITLKPIETRKHLLLDSIDFSKKTFHIVSLDFNNQEQISNGLKEYYKKKYDIDEVPKSLEKEITNVSSNSINESKFNNYGIVLYSKSTTNLKLAETLRSETYTITLR